MINRTVRKLDLNNHSSSKEDLEYWLSKTTQDRIEAIELLRRQLHGSSARLQRSACVIQQTQESSIGGDFGNLKVRYIGRNEFILNKRALGRKKDLADLEAVGEE
jgi:hypothetical protein